MTEKTNAKRRNVWCNCPGMDNRWDSHKAVSQIMDIVTLSSLMEKEYDNNETAQKDRNRLFASKFKNEEIREAAMEAAREMNEILENKDNFTGYHINHIVDGTYTYYVFTDNLELEGFDTLEEAEAFANEYDGDILDFRKSPNKEWYAVIHTPTGKRAYDNLFPLESRAIAFLYKAAMPPAWERYRTLCGDTIWEGEE